MLMTVREMISLSWETYKKNWRGITAYLFLSALCFFGMCLLFAIPIILGMTVAGNFGLVIFLILGGVLFFIALFAYFKIMFGFELQLRHALHKEKLLSFREAFAQTKPLTWTALGASLLSSFISTTPFLIGCIGLIFTYLSSFSSFLLTNTVSPLQVPGVQGNFFFLLIIYGIFHLCYFSIIFSMSFYSALFDKKKVRESLEFSKSLIQGRWWSVWWRFFAPEMILMVVYFVLVFVVLFVQKMHGELAASILNMGVAFFINCFAAVPLIYLPALVLYDDLKKHPVKKD